jgi:prepilin-type N-terminal cleavage/methylation domain-containing protein
MNRFSRGKGFTLIELLLVIAIVALLIGILLPALGEARRAARLAMCLSNGKQFGTATQSYASDFQDRLWGFNWRKGETQSNWPQLNSVAAASDLRAAVAQVIDILWRRADRTDIQPPPSWIPHVLYSHTILQDYLAQRLPEPMVVCSEDQHRRNWQFDPRNHHDKGFWQPFQEPSPGTGAPPNAQLRWPYSSSYQPPPKTYDRSPEGLRISQASHNSYFVPTAGTLGGTRLANVTFPSRNVHVMDSEQRHFGRQHMYYGVESGAARVPLVLFDGSVNVYRTGDTNPGWQPNNESNPNPTRSGYTPRPWEAPTSTGAPAELFTGHYRWTRGGLRGVDIGGPEINTGQK